MKTKYYIGSQTHRVMVDRETYLASVGFKCKKTKNGWNYSGK